MDDEAVFARNRELQGLPIPRERRASIAATLVRQITSERTATDALAFEVEPATFTRMLEDGAK